MTLRGDYNKDGYVVRPKLAACSVDDSMCLGILKRKFHEGIDKYISYISTMQKLVEFQCIFSSPDIVREINKLGLQSPCVVSYPVLHIMSPDLRIPDGYYGTGAHQDWASTQGSLDCITAWVALTDIGPENFPLEVIPGSHLSGLRDGKLSGSVLGVEADDRDFIAIDCKAGDVVFLSGFLVHRTGRGNGFRISVSQRFDNASEPTFIERGYPCAQKRVVDREIHWKPTVGQIRSVYGVD